MRCSLTALAGLIVFGIQPVNTTPQSVPVGARADLVLLSSDPRTDIAALARPIGVVLRGSWRPR